MKKKTTAKIALFCFLLFLAVFVSSTGATTSKLGAVVSGTYNDWALESCVPGGMDAGVVMIIM